MPNVETSAHDALEERQTDRQTDKDWEGLSPLFWAVAELRQCRHNITESYSGFSWREL